MHKPKKWTEVYPHGTREGDEESRFFKALARHPKYDWRSTGAIVKTSGLSQERVEELIDKYVNYNPPLIFSHPKNDGTWGYWERVPHMLQDDQRDIASKDKDNRIGKHISNDKIDFSDANSGCNEITDDFCGESIEEWVLDEKCMKWMRDLGSIWQLDLG